MVANTRSNRANFLNIKRAPKQSRFLTPVAHEWIALGTLLWDLLPETPGNLSRICLVSVAFEVLCRVNVFVERNWMLGGKIVRIAASGERNGHR